MKMWISRTKKHGLYLTPSMPRYYKDIDIWCYSKEYEDGTHMLNAGLQLDSKLYPEVTFENSPMEVELKLIMNTMKYEDVTNKMVVEYKAFISLVRRMREAQKRKEFVDSTLERKAMYECRKLTKQRESEVDEYLEKMEE